MLSLLTQSLHVNIFLIRTMFLIIASSDFSSIALSFLYPCRVFFNLFRISQRAIGDISNPINYIYILNYNSSINKSLNL